MLSVSCAICWTREGVKKNVYALSASKRHNRGQTLMTAVAPACSDDTRKDAQNVPIQYKLPQRNYPIVTLQLLAQSILDQIAARSLVSQTRCLI